MSVHVPMMNVLRLISFAHTLICLVLDGCECLEFLRFVVASRVGYCHYVTSEYNNVTLDSLRKIYHYCESVLYASLYVYSFLDTQ